MADVLLVDCCCETLLIEMEQIHMCCDFQTGPNDLVETCVEIFQKHSKYDIKSPNRNDGNLGHSYTIEETDSKSLSQMVTDVWTFD